MNGSAVRALVVCTVSNNDLPDVDSIKIAIKVFADDVKLIGNLKNKKKHNEY